MRTVRLKIYQYNELSEKAKERVLKDLGDINVAYEWWQFDYEDAEQIGIKITGFNLDKGGIEGKLLMDMNDSIELVKANHGEQTETYKTANAFYWEWVKLVAEHSDGVNKEKVLQSKEAEFDELADELENQYLNCMLKDYLKMLQKGYNYMTSKKAIEESIAAKEYEFTVDGKHFVEPGK